MSFLSPKEKCCFHCGLALTAKNPVHFIVNGMEQSFCCEGCKAVCTAIITSGNGDYYQHRSETATTFKTELPPLLNQLKLYDKIEIQKDFVRSDKNNHWKEAWLILEEIRCSACLWLNEQTLRQLDGVLDVQMDYTGQQARVRWDPRLIKLSEILTAIANIGYIAHPFDPSHREALNKEQQQRSLQRILFAIILGMMVMQTAIGSYFFGEVNTEGEYPLWILLSRWTSLIATAFILIYPGQLFFVNAWRDLKNKRLGMDVPIALGLSVAWLGSLMATIQQQGEVYYESIAMFVLFLLIARYIELKTRISATHLLDRAAKIIPTMAFRQKIKPKDVFEEVAVIELQQGDVIRLLPGDVVPVDGYLISAESFFDESPITGESLAVKHQKGEKVISGSMNIEQTITLRVLTNSANSTLTKIQQLSQESLNDRPYYVALADQVAGRFVAAILVIALLTLFFWLWADATQAISHTIAVLIITCPCALALAAPVSLTLCVAGLARLHMMTLRMSSIERINQVDTVVFDKTGTLTTGIASIQNILLAGRLSTEDCLLYAAKLEEGSEHPFAKAFRHAVKELSTEKLNTIQLKKRLNHLGKGIEAVMDGQKWKLGNEPFAGTEKRNVTVLEQTARWRQQGYSVLFLSHQNELQAIFAIKDSLREGIKGFLSHLKTVAPHIKRQVILSGDHKQNVAVLALELGITESYGDMSPEDKVKWVTGEQQQGHYILMFGDGINDAPTLASAHVSVTFDDATALSQRYSDWVILSKDYKLLTKAIKLMLKTRQIILQNLLWAIAYNVIAIPAAVIGWVTPWIAAIGMSISSLVVVMNALRLKKDEF